MTIDLLKATGRQPNSVTYFAAAVSCEEERFVQARLKGGKGFAFHLGGQRLEDSKYYRLPPGHHQLVVRAAVGKVPKFLKNVTGSIILVEVPKPERAMDAWRKQLEGFRARIEDSLAELPTCSERDRLRYALKAIDGTD